MSHNPHTPTNEKARAGERRAVHQNRQLNNTGNTAKAQRQRLLISLCQRPMSTIEIRKSLDILGVAPRVFELRQAGNHIMTYWRQEPTDSGKLHRVAVYVLVKEAQA